MPNVFTTFEGNVYLENGGYTVSTYSDEGFIMLEPTYSTKKRKDILVNLPYMNGEIDFSKQYGDTAFYESCEVTYRFVQQWPPTSTGAADMAVKHAYFEGICWDVDGDVYDDYGAVTLHNARCTSFQATPYPGDNILMVEVTFRGVR